jgi:uncharacterized protein YprB with RNaseH-like and TPR domain
MTTYQKHLPSSIDAILWLTNTMNSITIKLISKMEIKLISDLHILHNERKIKHKHKNTPVQYNHFEHNVNILLEELQNQITEEITTLKNHTSTPTINMSLLKSKPHLFKHTSWEPTTTTSPKSIMQITSHENIYTQLKDIQQDIIFLDTETDGLNVHKNNILSICMITINMQPNPLYSDKPTEHLYLIKPHQNYTIDQNSTASQIHKISQMNLNKNGLNLKIIGPTIVNLLTNKIIVGFNINSFDIPILRNNLKKHNITLPPLQTIDLYQAHYKLIKHNLQTALKNLNCYPIPTNLQHTANADADACIRLLAEFTKKLKLPTNKDSYNLSHMPHLKNSIFNPLK